MENSSETEPIAPIDNGRRPDGTFAPGNPGGPGNPNARAVAAWRSALVEAVAADDIKRVVEVLIEKAKAGESWAVRELLDRCLGRPQQKMELEAVGEKTWAAMLACLQTAAVNQGSEQ